MEDNSFLESQIGLDSLEDIEPTTDVKPVAKSSMLLKRECTGRVDANSRSHAKSNKKKELMTIMEVTNEEEPR